MSEDGVYPSSVLSFLGDVEFEAARSRSNFGFKVAHCSIGEVRGVIKWSKIGLQEFRILPEVRG